MTSTRDNLQGSYRLFMVIIALVIILSTYNSSVCLGATLPEEDYKIDLKSADQSTALLVIERIRNTGPATDKKLINLLKGAFVNTNEVVRLNAIETMALMGPKAADGAKDLAKTLSDKDPNIRESAIMAIMGLGAEQAVTKELMESLNDPNPNVRSAAGLALSRAGKPAIADLIKLLGAADETISEAAEDTLVKMGPLATPALIKMLDGKDQKATMAASRALARIGKPAVKPLIKRLGDKDEKTSEIAGGILTKMGASAVPELVEALKIK